MNNNIYESNKIIINIRVDYSNSFQKKKSTNRVGGMSEWKSIRKEIELN